MVRNNLAAYFEDEGMKVTGVESYEAARDLIQDLEPFDICIMDIRLPGLDGNGVKCKALSSLLSQNLCYAS